MPDWFADEAFWTEIYPFEFPDPVIDAGVAQVDKALTLSGGQAGSRGGRGRNRGPGRRHLARH